MAGPLPAFLLMTPTWIFDLDDTLHEASRHAFPVIDAAMTNWLEENLAIDRHEANRLRVEYWQRYGATLLGLRRHHAQFDPRQFLAACHPLDELLRQVHPMPGLQRTLARLPGRKILFTNGPSFYARAMLVALKIHRHFDGIAAIDTLRFTPKPQKAAFRQLLHAFRLDPASCIMVEDSLANLVTARQLGMRTIWLTRCHRHSPAADRIIHRLDDLAGIRL